MHLIDKLLRIVLKADTLTGAEKLEALRLINDLDVSDDGREPLRDRRCRCRCAPAAAE